MAMDCQSDDESRDLLEALTSEECLDTARFARGSKWRLRTARQRELAEETAKRFEARAVGKAPAEPSVIRELRGPYASEVAELVMVTRDHVDAIMVISMKLVAGSKPRSRNDNGAGDTL